MNLDEQFYTKVAFFEGFRSRPYMCPAGVLTIGYGHTRGVKPTDKVTLSQARELLRKDFTLIFNQLDTTHLCLNTFERYAVADFIFNLGFGYFLKSKFYMMLCLVSDSRRNGREDMVALQLRAACQKLSEYKYYHKDGKPVVSHGLEDRRKFEIDLITNHKIY